MALGVYIEAEKRKRLLGKEFSKRQSIEREWNYCFVLGEGTPGIEQWARLMV